MGCRLARPSLEPASPAVQRATGPDHALLQIKVKRDELTRRRSSLAQRVQQSLARARELARSGEKELAMQHLARKRLLQTDLEKMGDRLALLGSHINRIEALMDDSEIAAVLRSSNETIRELLEQADLAAMHDALALDAESAAVTQAVRDAFDQQLQDPDVLREYEQLGVEALPAFSVQTGASAQTRTAEKPLALA